MDNKNSVTKWTTLGVAAIVVSLAGLAPTTQAQDGDNCCSGTIDCEPSFTP